MSQLETQGVGASDAPGHESELDCSGAVAPCPIVGLGASAGGLEAFQHFLEAAPDDGGLAYVLVQHLDPNHESMLAELLGRCTTMPVRQVVDGALIAPDSVYLIPPNAGIRIKNGVLQLTEFSEPRGFRRPIDDFFMSLADDQGPNAACVVLSGTGGDGSEGLRAIKDAGGLTIAQDLDTAKYDGMPKSAVATGLVDKVLRVAEMPQALREYFDRARPGFLDTPDATDFLIGVCSELRHRLGHDFSHYKRSTMLRRVQRRMQVVGSDDGRSYLEMLRETPDEASLLFRDLLINVTSFFRDAEAFEVLRQKVIPELLRDKGAGDTIRIWTPGCSSGEEAYSVAILMAEALARLETRPGVQVFATDIDEQMLQKAREAHYPHGAVKEVPPELLDRYFHAEEDDFVVNQHIRDMVRVSSHNLIKDPPFSRVDLIVCRNLLIYLNTDLQQRLIPVFHYSLKPKGWLFLGSAENIASRKELFDTFDSSAKIYRRRNYHRTSFAIPLFNTPAAQIARDMEDAEKRRRMRSPERIDLITKRVMERHAPPHVVVSADNEVVRSSSRTGKYLELAEGAPSNKITDLAKRGLRAAIRGVLETARSKQRRAIRREVRIEIDDDTVLTLDVVADPISETETLLVFHDVDAFRRDVEDDEAAEVDGFSDDERVRNLEDELDETRSRLRTTVEELETSNEELKSSNEEMMSMNEELQSTNEELSTVNEELKNKVDQLGRANSDLQNFIESTQIPTIFLDARLRIRSFTPASKVLFSFQDQDRGRAFSDVTSRIEHDKLKDMCKEVLETGEPVEQEFDIDDGAESYVLRVLPYKDLHDAVDGVVLVFTDVTTIRDAQADIERHEGIVRRRGREIETLYKTAPVGMALVDRNMRVLKLNQQFAELADPSVEEHVGRKLEEVLPALSGRMERPIQEVFDTGEGVANTEVTVELGEEGVQDFLIDFYSYKEEDRIAAVGVILKNVTELRRLEKELRRIMYELQHRVKNTLATVVSIVNQTVAAKGDPQEMVDRLKQRIGALAATHDLLTKEDWRAASLREILKRELDPYAAAGPIELDGPIVRLPPKHALTLTLTLHELATNAAKYGALAHEGGRLRVEWIVAEDASERRLTLKWKETGVPGLEDAKPRESFGARLIKNAVVHDLQGESTHELQADGLLCVLSVPL